MRRPQKTSLAKSQRAQRGLLKSSLPVSYTHLTLPSGHYLEHPPQYIPPSPRYPLTRELSHEEETLAAPAPGEEVLPPASPARP